MEGFPSCALPPRPSWGSYCKEPKQKLPHVSGRGGETEPFCNISRTFFIVKARFPRKKTYCLCEKGHFFDSSPL